MNELKKFEYKDNEITFQLGNGETMVNATQMAKAFEKRPNDFLNLTSTTAYIEALSDTIESGIVDAQLVTTVKGGNVNNIPQGTWMIRPLALKFAAWLSPHFEVWVYDRIEELMINGYTKLDSISRKDLARMLFESEEEKELAQAEIKRNKRKVNYFDDVLTSKSTYPITQIAKELGMSGRALNKKLNELQIQYKQGDAWLLYADYQDRNYTNTRTTRYLNREGEILTKMYTVWTESGRRFIHTKLRQQRNKRIR